MHVNALTLFDTLFIAIYTQRYIAKAPKQTEANKIANHFHKCLLYALWYFPPNQIDKEYLHNVESYQLQEETTDELAFLRVSNLIC